MEKFLPALILLVGLANLAVCSNFVVVAPNVMRWEQEEKVIVTLPGNTRKNVKLYMKDWPLMKKTFSRQTKNVGGGQDLVGHFEMKVQASDFPTDPESLRRLKLGERRYVLLYAEVEGEVKETRILMSNKIANVFVQTDKPIYTPGQTVQVTVYSTDLDNIPIKMPIRLDVVSPSGFVVQRIEAETEYISRITNQSMQGMYRQDIKLIRAPKLGNWSIVAGYGPQINGIPQYLHSTRAAIEIKEYVLPTFSCKVKDIDYFIVKDSASTFKATVSARYTHGKPVVGNVTIRFGIMDEKNIKYIMYNQRELHQGDTTFYLNTTKLYAHIPNFNFTKHVEGKRLMIQAFCTEDATGDRMEDLNSQAIFVTTPFAFNFDRTISHFKPGLPVVLQFQVFYRNGQEAKEESVSVHPTGTTNNNMVVPLNLQANQQSDTVRTDQHGRARVIYGSRADLKLITVKFKVTVGLGGGDQATRDHEETLVLKPAHAETDIVIEQSGEPPMKIENSASIGIHMKGKNITEFTWMIMSRGRILKVEKKVGAWASYQILQVPITRAMVPSARIVVFFIQDNILGGDSLWLDVENKCKNKMNIATRNKDGVASSFLHTGLQQKLWVNVEWSSNAFVVLQMVDHAVLALNDRTNLTPRRMWQQLDALDMGCGGGSGSNSSDMFARSGLAVSTPLKDFRSPFNTGMRLLDSCDEPIDYYSSRRRRKRQVTEQQITLEECCSWGTQNDVTGLNNRCEPIISTYMFSETQYSSECLDMIRFCCRNTSVEPVLEEGGERSAFTDDERVEFIQAVAEAGIRENFEESFFIGIANLGENGQGSVSFDMRDSITTWSVEAVGIDSVSGMCVAQPHDYTVTKNIFMKVHLPNRAVRGEHLNARVTLYNFVNLEITVGLYMRGVEGICSSVADGGLSRRYVTVGALKAKSVSWPIVPMKLGVHRIRFVAMIGTKPDKKNVKDAIDKQLTVVAEGVPQVYTQPFIVDMNSNRAVKTGPVDCGHDGHKMKCNVAFWLPAFVEGSVIGRIRMIGNTFGPAVDIVVNGLAGKLNMPYGCGEQIMTTVAPGVYAFDYMQKTGSMTVDVEEKLPGIVSAALTKLLKYHSNGGFSVWTGRPTKTWLTSLIIKVFSKANQLVVGVDQYLLNGAIEFVYSRQTTAGNDKGKFMEHSAGLIRYDRNMVGAISVEDLTLTAYVAFALCEANPELSDARINDTFDYLARNVETSSTAYEKALVAYALSFSYKPERHRAYQLLKNAAEEEIYQDSRWRYIPAKSKKLRVEASSYAILTALRHDDIDYCYDLMIWLHRQRTNGGIFSTTQDTVTALQALSTYAIATKNRETSLTVTVENLKNEEDGRTFQITDDDRNVEVIRELDETVVVTRNPVSFTVEGNGIVQVTVEALYNIEDHGQEIPPFRVNIKHTVREIAVQEEKGTADKDLPDLNLGDGNPPAVNNVTNEMNITIQARYNMGEQTEMAMIEVGLLTGYTANTDTLKQMVKDNIIDAYEVSDAMVSMYLPYIRRDEVTEVSFIATQEVGAENLAPAVVKVYDYYNREHEYIGFYPKGEGIPSHQLIPGGDECYEGRCSKCYGPATTDEGETEYISLPIFQKKACSTAVTYVYKVAYNATRETEDWVYTDLVVEKVLKAGGIQVQVSDKIVLRQRSSCPCPVLLQHHEEGNDKFFMYGKDEMISKDQEFVFTANSDTFLEVWKRGRLRDHLAFLNEQCRL